MTISGEERSHSTFSNPVLLYSRGSSRLILLDVGNWQEILWRIETSLSSPDSAIMVADGRGGCRREFSACATVDLLCHVDNAGAGICLEKCSEWVRRPEWPAGHLHGSYVCLGNMAENGNNRLCRGVNVQERYACRWGLDWWCCCCGT